MSKDETGDRPGLVVITAEELMQIPRPDVGNPCLWNGWWVDRASRSIILGKVRTDGSCLYEIPVSGVTTAAGAWGWTRHMAEKGWIKAPVLRGLVKIICELQMRGDERRARRLGRRHA